LPANQYGYTGYDLKSDHGYRKDQGIIIQKTPAPHFKEFLHFIAQSKGVIGFYEPGKNKQYAYDDTGYVQ
jgi:hypothetical protein